MKNNELPWISLSVNGYPHTPITWNKSEHCFEFSGENDYMYVILPDDQFICYTLLSGWNAH